MELKSKITEKRSSLEEFNKKFEWAEERLSEYEGRTTEIIKSKIRKEKEEKWPQPNVCMGEHKSRPVVCIMGVSEGEDSERNRKNIWGNNGRNFPNMMKGINPQV